MFGFCICANINRYRFSQFILSGSIPLLTFINLYKCSFLSSVAARCSKDIKGSKIVPIAVGAALAGLVIIVLVAYIIGRLRSRKQSSYEALS